MKATVMNYGTGEPHSGVASESLIAASAAAGENGVVAAYDDGEGVWHHVADHRVDDYRRMGHDVVTVYVAS